MSKPTAFDRFKLWGLRHPGFVRFFFNIWPPFIFSGMYIDSISKDFMHAQVRLRWTFLTHNINGSQYGGSIFSMTDPIYVTLLYNQLGMEKYYIWDKSVRINYVKAGYSTLFFRPSITQEQIDDIIEMTKEGAKYEPVFKDNICDRKGAIIAEVERTIYVRLKPKFRPQVAKEPVAGEQTPPSADAPGTDTPSTDAPGTDTLAIASQDGSPSTAPLLEETPDKTDASQPVT